MRTKVKREKDRVLNEATGQYEWVWVESTRYIHEEEDRVLAALDFLKGENTPEELVDNIGDLVPPVAVFWYRRFTLSDFS